MKTRVATPSATPRTSASTAVTDRGAERGLTEAEGEGHQHHAPPSTAGTSRIAPTPATSRATEATAPEMARQAVGPMPLMSGPATAARRAPARRSARGAVRPARAPSPRPPARPARDELAEPRRRHRGRGHRAAHDGGVAHHGQRQEPVGPPPHPQRRQRSAEHEQQQAHQGHHHAVDGDCTSSSTSPAAVTATSTARGRPGSRPCPPHQGAPQEGDHGDAQDRDRHHARHRSVLHEAPEERPETADRRRHAGEATRARPRTAPSYRALRMATPRVGTAAAPAPWKSRAASSTPKEGAKAATSAPLVIRPMR